MHLWHPTVARWIQGPTSTPPTLIPPSASGHQRMQWSCAASRERFSTTRNVQQRRNPAPAMVARREQEWSGVRRSVQESLALLVLKHPAVVLHTASATASLQVHIGRFRPVPMVLPRVDGVLPPSWCCGRKTRGHVVCAKLQS